MKRIYLTICLSLLSVLSLSAEEEPYDVDALPDTADGFGINIFVREPKLIHPAAMAVGKHGRLFVGGGPQFRDPDPDTPPDKIHILVDSDHDGKADEVKLFASGFNSIQALAWKGDELWVANAPDLTVVRDTDGDDRADRYRLVYTDLGHLRHGLHGFNWAPDGRLYMSQGNSKVQGTAPKAFRKLMGVDSDKPDNQPLNKVFSPEEYESSYIGSWPSGEGGILRCDENGENLEIVSRGMRNPWDMKYDAGFNWTATDNDPGPEHDRIIMPFFGAHFGLRHPWSFSWTGENHPMTAPISDQFPTAQGSGTGIVYYTADHFPEQYQNTFYIGDWTNNRVYIYRTQWDGALQRGQGKLNTIATAGANRASGELGYKAGEGIPIFRPTDLVVGPGGALFVASWGPHYGSIHAPYRKGDKKAKKNYGRIFRLRYKEKKLRSYEEWHPEHRNQPHKKWTYEQLLADLDSQIQAWRVNAQDELVQRGSDVADQLLETLRTGDLSRQQETWVAWTLGRIGVHDQAFASFARGGEDVSLNLRIQALRILGDKLKSHSDVVADQLQEDQPRVRKAATQALRYMKADEQQSALLQAVASESDRICFYIQWQALRHLLSTSELKELLNDDRANVRRAALLALLEEHKLSNDRVIELSYDESDRVASIATTWLQKQANVRRLLVKPDGGEFYKPLTVELSGRVVENNKLTVRYTLDGSNPTSESKKYTDPITIKTDRTLSVGVFKNGKQLGDTHTSTFSKMSKEEYHSRLIVENIQAKTDRKYELAPHGLRKGAAVYTDRNYAFTNIPEDLQGATYIKTPNEDSGTTEGELLSFKVSTSVTVYVAHDERIHPKPSWLSNQFVETKKLLTISDESSKGFRLYRRTAKPGTITLGGNHGSDATSMYQVLLVKTQVTEGQMTSKQVLEKLMNASAENGREIYFSQSTCSSCHRLNGKGTSIGPDLSDIGSRAKPPYIIESILKPSAVIIEGYEPETIKLTNGKQLLGMVREETEKNVKVYLPDGSSNVISTDNIKNRNMLDQSLMPPGFGLRFSTKEIADLTYFLMQQKGDD